jgi:hypothetical protein
MQVPSRKNHILSLFLSDWSSEISTELGAAGSKKICILNPFSPILNSVDANHTVFQSRKQGI